MEYPSFIHDLFEGQNIETIPTFKINNTDNNDYIDFVNAEEMSDPIMKFVDESGRPGFLFRIKGKTDKEIDLLDQTVNIKDICITLSIFRRFSYSDYLKYRDELSDEYNSYVQSYNRWAHAFNDPNSLFGRICSYFTYDDRMNFCKFEDVLESIKYILNGKSQYFEIN